MFLLPGAERYRRVLLFGSCLLLLTFQAIVGFAPVERAVLEATGPLLRPLTRLSGAALSWIQPESGVLSGESGLLPSALVEMERRQGRPPTLPGLAWLEVPVVATDGETGRMTLAAGEDVHLAVGQVVAYADHFLGRVAIVRERTAEVDLITAPNMRTGAALLLADGEEVAAISLGRGRAGPAVLRWLEQDGLVEQGQRLRWRPRPGDDPNLHAAHLLLGVVAQEGDAERGTASWVVQHQAPAGAEGRVFIAAGAVGPDLVAEIPRLETSARRLLLEDAVLGPGWCAIQADAEHAPTVLVDRGRVGGRILSWRGNWGWCRLMPSSEWADEAVGLELSSSSVLPWSRWREQTQEVALFTRGGLGIPRGLWIGPQTLPALKPAHELLVVGQVPREEEGR